MTSIHALSETEMRSLAPSIFAMDAHESRSDRYTYIPTIDVVRGMQNEGFVPVRATQSRTRDASRQEFTKHMVRFRHESGMVRHNTKVGDVFPEIVLINSHDGTSSYRIMAGLFRLVCLNGMVVADEKYGDFKVPHKGDILNDVIDASFEVLDESQEAVRRADDWAQIELKPDERVVFAEAAHTLRFEEDSGIPATRLLNTRRAVDNEPNLWNTFNVVQENVIKGGLHGWKRQAETGRTRRVSSREVKNIDNDIRLNRGLWLLGERMAELTAN